jgi:hypothetical protein
MGNRSREVIQPDGEKSVKGYGLFVYGGMMALAGGILAESRPAFLALAALGSVAFIIGSHTLLQRARIARQRLRNGREIDPWPGDGT